MTVYSAEFLSPYNVRFPSRFLLLLVSLPRPRPHDGENLSAKRKICPFWDISRLGGVFAETYKTWRDDGDAKYADGKKQ